MAGLGCLLRQKFLSETGLGVAWVFAGGSLQWSNRRGGSVSDSKKPTRQPLPWPKEHDEVDDQTFEGHRNQAQTQGARIRQQTGASSSGGPRKKVVALQLEASEYERFQALGGAQALRRVLRDDAAFQRLQSLFGETETS